IFQRPGGNGTGNPLAFQPGTHNLSFVGTTLATWDVATGKLIKDYKVADASGTLAWSPDARFIAYVGAKGVNILGANSAQNVFTYTDNKLNVCQLAWSPNGKYIVSGEGQTEGNMVAKVWTAE